MTTAPTQTVLDTLSAIEQRRSVKHYDPNFQMPEADRDRLLELLMLSPTSFNIQNWRFVVVDDPEVRQQLKAAAWGQAQVTDASMLVLFCADLKSWDRAPERYWQNAPEAVQNQLVPMIRKFYAGRDELQRDEAMRSCGIAAQTLMLAAKAMGYDTCPMVGFDPDAVAKIIHLPQDHLTAMMVVVGRALEPARPRAGQLDREDVVRFNRF